MSTPSRHQSSHGCDRPRCMFLHSPTSYILDSNTCLTEAHDKRGRELMYCSRRNDSLATDTALKPLMLVPKSAVKTGFYHDSDIRLNKLIKRDDQSTKKSKKPKDKKKNRRAGKLGPSNLRYQVWVGC